MRSRLSLLVVAACPLTALPAQRARPAFARVDSAMLAELERSRTPGGAIAIVSGNRIVYANGYGRTAQAGGDPVTSATLFRIESVTKLFTAAAMLQLAEQGRVDLRSALGSTVGNIPAPI